jgi:hypothetical protein
LTATTTTLDVLRAWGVDVGVDGVAFPLTEDAPPFVPDAVLYNALSPAAVAWCGPAPPRLGASCLAQIFDDRPPAVAFARARAVVTRYRCALLFLVGRPTDVTDTDGNAGLQAILFHPDRGETSRVHFRWPAPVRLVIGEIGDAVVA